MLIPLTNKPPSDQSVDLLGKPIQVDLRQVKPKRKAGVKKEVVDSLPELRSTINRIFAHEDAVLITTQAELLDFLRQQEVFGLDTETTGLFFYTHKIAGFSLGTATRSAYIPLQHTVGQNYQDDIDVMCEILQERSYYWFNYTFDQHFLEKFNSGLAGLPIAGEGSVALRCYDICLPHKLKDAYRAVVDPDYEEYSFSKLFKGKPFTEFDPKDVYKYAAVDARKHYVLTDYFHRKLQEEAPDSYYRYRSIELRVLKPVYNAEEYGMCVSNSQIDTLYDHLEEQKVPFLASARDIVGDSEFNPSSPKQVIDAYSKIGYRLTSSTEEVIAKIKHPLTQAILDYRGVVKLQGTYTKNLYEFTDVREGNTIVHPSFLTVGADTSRMASKNPNMQNIPRGDEYRAIFIARPGNSLVSCDFSQQEVRIIAYLAGDEVMLEAFRSGKDFYAVMASIVFNLPYEDCTKKGKYGNKRNQMKAVVLGLNYSMGTKSLAADLTQKAIEEAEWSLKRSLSPEEMSGYVVSESVAQEIVDAFYKVCPKVHAFQQQALNFAKSHGYNETLYKHRRYYQGLGYAARGLNRFEIFGPGLKNGGVTAEEVLATLNSFGRDRYRLSAFIADLEKPSKSKDTKHLAVYVKDRERIAFAEERQTTNSIIQGTGAEMTKLAMIVAEDDPELKSLGAHMVNFVHDEIIIEAPTENAQKAGARLSEIMNDVCSDMLGGLDGGVEPEIMQVWRKG